MRIIVLALLFAFCVRGQELQPVPGLDFLGWGYDASSLDRDLFFAATEQLFEYTFKDTTKSYRYPTDTVSWAVPDQVNVRSIGKTTAESLDFDDTQTEILSLSLRLNLKLTTPQLQLELNLKLGLVTSSSEQKLTVVNTAETALWQLYLSKGTRKLRPEVIALASEVSKIPFKTNPKPYNDFIKRFGTHYVETSVLGGYVKQRTIFNYKNDTEKLYLTVGIAGKFGSSGGTSVEGSIDFSLQSITSKIRAETVSTGEVIGGLTDFSGTILFEGGEPGGIRTLFNSWKATLPRCPISVKYRLMEIFTLFDDEIVKKELCTAVGTKLGFLPDEDKAYCDRGGNNLITGTLQGGVTGL